MHDGNPLLACHGCAEKHFTPALRPPAESVLRLAEQIEQTQLVQTLLDAYPEIVIIVNRERSIVACNSVLPAILGCEKSTLIGQRPGDAVGCVHAGAAAGGCGTSESCRFCGALQAMAACIETRRPTRRECRVQTQELANSFELAVLATALQFGDDELTIVAFRDTSGEIRRALLERTFFHDALNLAGGIQGLSEMAVRGDEADFQAISGRLHVLVNELVEQIRAQRDLLAAERGDLRPHPTRVSARGVLETTRESYELNPACMGRRIIVEMPDEDDVCVDTDPALLARVLGNLTKNALEASAVGQAVTMRCKRTPDGSAAFEVHNAALMPREVQLQLFHRSFSTKGSGRGVGTFSVKLLTERYLNGRVTFRSEPGHGTTFEVCIPAVPAGATNEPASIEESRVLATRRVLLAEDGPEIRRIVTIYLERAGAVVSTAENGAVALRVYERQADSGVPHDLIVLDHDMPVLDGLKTGVRLRALGYAGPLVLLTADATAAMRNSALESGFTDVVCKPVSQSSLIDTLAKQIAEHSDGGAPV